MTDRHDEPRGHRHRLHLRDGINRRGRGHRSRGREVLASVARAVCNGRVEDGRPTDPSGARRRTFDGRRRFQDADPASPIVWGDKLFVLTAIPAGSSGAASHQPRGGIQPRDVHRFVVIALDRHTGKVVWERTARETRPHEASHQDNGTWASSSAITDGSRVYAYFESKACTRTTWTASCSGKRTSATRRCGTSSARAARPCCTATGSSSCGITRGRRSSSHSTRRPEGALAQRSEGDRLVGHAARGGARGPRPGRHERHEPVEELRPRDRQDRVGERRA